LTILSLLCSHAQKDVVCLILGKSPGIEDASRRRHKPALHLKAPRQRSYSNLPGSDPPCSKQLHLRLGFFKRVARDLLLKRFTC
jgi:hypothetical protein